MATIPTTDCSFGDIVTAYNTTVASGSQISMNNINLKTSFSGKTIYNPGWPITGTTVIPSSSISTSLFYGKTFQKPTPTVTFSSSSAVVDANAGAQSWNNPTIMRVLEAPTPKLYALYTGVPAGSASLTVKISTNLNTSWQSPAGGSGGAIIDSGMPGAWAGQYSMATGDAGNVYFAYGKSNGLWLYQQNSSWNYTAPGPHQLISPANSARYVSIAIISIPLPPDYFTVEDWIYISYQDYNSGNIKFAYYKKNTSYTPPPTLSATIDSNSNNYANCIALGNDASSGGPLVFIVWLQYNNSSSLYNVKFKKGTYNNTISNYTWTSISNIDSAWGSSGATVNLYAKDDNNLYLSYVNSSQKIVLKKSTDGGSNWDAGVVINEAGSSVDYACDMHVKDSNIWISYHYGSQDANLGAVYSYDNGSTWYQGASTSSVYDARTNAITVYDNKAYIIGAAGTGNPLECVTVEIT